jgi:periplasmic copper chaperone A
MKSVPFTLRGPIAAALLSCLLASAEAADITVKNAWMRPARAGTAAAGVYVDIVANVPLKLVGAKSPAAKSVALVLVEPKPDGTSVDHIVKEVELPGGKETRFAYNGNRLDLLDLSDNLLPGVLVPLTLYFVEGPSSRQDVEIQVLVRGVILPPAEPEKTH